VNQVTGVQSRGAFPVLPDHRDEAAQEDAVRAQDAVLAQDERDRLGLAPPAQRHDEPSARPELAEPRWRDVEAADRDDCPVVGCFVRHAEARVAGGDVHAGEPGPFEAGCCLGGDFRVDVDGGDVPAWPGEGGEQRGVPPGTRSCLEDTVAVADVELLEHGTDETGDRGARQRFPPGIPLGDHGKLGVVSVGKARTGDEGVAWHRANRVKDAGSLVPTGRAAAMASIMSSLRCSGLAAGAVTVIASP